MWRCEQGFGRCRRMGAADHDGGGGALLYARGDFERLAIIGSEERGDADDVGLERCDIVFDHIKRCAKMIVTMERRERRLVADGVVFGQVAQLLRNSYGAAAGAAVVVFDEDVDLGKMLFYR